jgi:hypothetical protein
MRLMLSMAVTAVALAACGQSEEAFRADYRTKAVSSCVTGARSSPNAAQATAAGINPETLCNCMIDRYMRDTPIDRLKSEANSSTPPPAAQAAAQQCAMEAVRTINPAAAAAAATRDAAGTAEQATRDIENATRGATADVENAMEEMQR